MQVAVAGRRAHGDVTMGDKSPKSARKQAGQKQIKVDQEARLEFKLQLGAVSQTVSIEASIPLINTENSVKGDSAFFIRVETLIKKVA